MRFRASIPLSLLPFLLAAAALSGCGKSAGTTAPVATSPTTNDQAAITGTMAIEPELSEDPLFMSEETTSLGATPGAASALPRGATPASAIQPLRYWRHITDVQRRFEFAFSRPDSNGDPTAAIVTIHKDLLGTFNIATPAPAPSDTGSTLSPDTTDDDPADLNIVRKRLHDHWVRRVLLRRVPTDRERHVWRIAGTSGVSVESVLPAASVQPPTHIVSLRIETANLDTMITDPLGFVMLRRILKVAPGESVKLTVTTGTNDDVVVLMHHGERFRFRNNGDNTYSGTWTVPDGVGIRHFGVNALSNGTLFDDQAPYNSDAWLFPYVTVPMTVDYLP